MSTILSLGLVRGLLAQIAGTALGMGLTAAVRVMLGMPAWKTEPVMVVGAMFGWIAFLIGVGALSDWLKWVRGIETPLHHGPPRDRPAWTRYWSVDYNHKIIGIQYAVTGVLLLLFGGGLALVFRTELAQTGVQFLGPDTYNTFMSAHGIIVIVAILLGVGGMANYLVPLMIGASDMAFPRLNAFAFWANVPGALLLIAAMFVGGWDTGWTGYPPLSATGPRGVQLFFLGMYFIGLGSILGSLNILVTIIRMRAPGMSLFRMPIFVWAILATSIIQLTGTQLIGLSFAMVLVQRVLGMGFFDPATGGDPILYQHLFWFYSHPAVYLFVLPGLGIISELLPVFARKPLFGYKWVALSSLGIALIGFTVWAQHMFTSGMPDGLRVPFSFSTLLIAVPTGIKFFSWMGTLWQGKILLRTPMLFALGAISVFLIGGLSGPPLGTVPTNLHLHDSYYVVGHLHATFFGGFIFPFFGAVYYWFPKVTGRMYNERLGKLHFWLMTVAFWVQSLGMIYVGTLGMQRRVVDYDPALNIEFAHGLITLAAFTIGLSVLLGLYNLVRSARTGEVAGANPWRSRSPEWQIPSPIPEHSYAQPFTIVGEPYDYGRSGSSYIRMSPAVGSD